MKEPCVAFVEYKTIATGIRSVDALLKKASVEIIVAHPVSSGKYICMFSGDVESVKSSLFEAKQVAGSALIDSFFIPNLHPEIIKVLQSTPEVGQLEGIAILETSTCASCIVAADKALKTADVKLLRVHLAQGIAGKAYFIINGEIGELESALLPAISLARKSQTLIDKVIIPKATHELLQALNY